MLIWFERLEDGLFQKSRSMGPPWGAVLRWLRYPAALIRDWLGGEINVRAMSLAYTTLLSIVPLMVFAFAVLKGLGARGDLKFLLHQFFRPMGSAATQLTDSVMQFVVNMRGEVLGSIGLAFLVYTVITTIQKIEASFNFVWRVERPRSFGRRSCSPSPSDCSDPPNTVRLRNGCKGSRRSRERWVLWAKSCRMPSSPSFSHSCIRWSPTLEYSFAPLSSGV
jgi:hypothetical protein